MVSAGGRVAVIGEQAKRLWTTRMHRETELRKLNPTRIRGPKLSLDRPVLGF